MNHSTGKRRDRQGGQAIVMVTLALISMCGMMGLAVDLGWSYFVRRSERVAADAAALAAARAALASGTCNTTVTGGCALSGHGWRSSSAGLSCTGISVPYLTTGCTYATKISNGSFTTDQVYIASDFGPPPSLGDPTAFNGGLCSGAKCTVNAFYYVTATVQKSVPQLFSAVLGNPTALVAVRATAVIANEQLRAEFTLTDRAGDPASPLGQGADLCIGGTASGCAASGVSGGDAINLYVPGGIAIASDSPTVAGVISKNSTTTCPKGSTCGPNNLPGPQNTPFTYILESDNGTTKGGISGGGTANWLNQPLNAFDSGEFQDPKEGFGQPPITMPSGSSNGTAVPDAYHASPGFGDTSANPKIITPGQYYTVDPLTGVVDYKPLTLDCGLLSVCYYAFSNSPSNAADTTFSNYIFYGGLHVGTGAVVTFGPGVYTLAGVNTGGFQAMANAAGLLKNNSTACAYSGGSVCPSLLVDPGGSTQATVLTDQDPSAFSAQSTTTAGELFLFTNPSSAMFSGVSVPPPLQGKTSNFGYGTSGLCYDASACNNPSGNANPTLLVDLHGLNNNNGDLACGTTCTNSSLATLGSNFNGFLMWQDQANSYVKYTSNGSVDRSCGGINGYCAGGVSSPSKTPELDLPLGSTGVWNPNGSCKGCTGASSKIEVDVWGAIYQPRGAWAQLSMNGSTSGGAEFDTLTLITGALAIQGKGNLLLNGIGGFVTTLGAALVE